MSKVFVIIKMCYVHNHWYDISCATLYYKTNTPRFTKQHPHITKQNLCVILHTILVGITKNYCAWNILFPLWCSNNNADVWRLLKRNWAIIYAALSTAKLDNGFLCDDATIQTPSCTGRQSVNNRYVKIEREQINEAAAR